MNAVRVARIAERWTCRRWTVVRRRFQPLPRVARLVWRRGTAPIVSAALACWRFACRHSPARAFRTLAIAYEIAQWMPLAEFEARIAKCTTPEEVLALCERQDVPLRVKQPGEPPAGIFRVPWR